MNQSLTPAPTGPKLSKKSKNNQNKWLAEARSTFASSPGYDRPGSFSE